MKTVAFCFVGGIIFMIKHKGKRRFMRAVKHPGKCRLCGELKELTPEHIPPKSAFNTNNITVLPFEEVCKTLTGADGRMPWDINGLKGKVQQGGHKKYCLCKECNNNTGNWYMRAYTDFAKTVNAIIQIEHLLPENTYSFTIKDLYPLRVFKAMMTMICDLNNNCFGDSNLRDFLMTKESNIIDTSKYSLYMYLVSPQAVRMSGISAQVHIEDPKNPVLVSEMSAYPIGFAMYLDKPKDYTPFGLNVDCFADVDYNTKCNVQFSGIPYLDINSQFPIDFRSKDDIIKCIVANEKSLD
jgi:hypothetical protein